MAMDSQTPTVESETPLEFAVRLSPDRTEVLLDCPDPLERLHSRVNAIVQEFDLLDLPNYPDRQKLVEMLRRVARPGEDLVGQVLISGKKPKPPQHGNLNWSREFFSRSWVIDPETDTIDYRERVGNGSVRRNELLVLRFEPREGESGTDVFGNPIPVAKAQSVSIRCGKGVTMKEEDGVTSFFADRNGRVVFKDGSVSVDEVYAINGNVDLKSGNIHHTGSITVSGDIRAGATVEADGDIIVHGLLEPCHIRCGGDLIVAGGIIGDENHRIVLGGNLEARYIKEANVQADGDILVLKEINHSLVRTQGSVKVPRGRIVGGETIALRGICVSTAGGPSGARTILRAGVDWSLKSRIDVFLEKIARLEASLAPVETALKNAENSSEVYSEAINRVIEDLAEKRMLIGQSISIEYMRIGELTMNTVELAVPYVVMTDAIWYGTGIFLGDSFTKVPRSILKPRLATLKDTRARIVPLGDANWPETNLCG